MFRRKPSRQPAWSSFDEARELFYAANLTYRASSRRLNAVPLLRRCMLSLLRAMALNAGVSSSERDDIVAAAVEVEERERVLRFPVARDLELLAELERRFASFEAATSTEEAGRLEWLIETMPQILTSVRRHLAESGLTPVQRARRRRRSRWAAVLLALAALGLIGFGAVSLAGPLYRAVAFDGVSGAYFADAALKTFMLERRDPEIAFDWRDDAPDSDLPADGFSVRWTGKLRVPESGRYTFYLNSDDGSRLYVDDKLVIDNWSAHSELELAAPVELGSGLAPIRVEYFDKIGRAIIQLSWSTPSRGKHVITGASFVR